MALTHDQVHEKLQAQFGDTLSLGGVEDAGDTFVQVPASALFDVVQWLRDDPAMQFNGLQSISGVCYGADKPLASVYHLDSYLNNLCVALHVEFEDRDNASVASLTPLYSAADWHERESYDLLGIHYEGHPNLVRILCAEDWVGHPLRKDYEPPTEFHGIRNDI